MSNKKIEELVIDGETYVPKKSIQEEPRNSNIKIVILQRGNVMIGRWSQDGDMCTLENAHVIRYWGTERGLGQLALEGATTDTKLDKAGHVEFHILTTVATINCVESLWDGVLL